jgi:MFS family permease
LNIFALLIVGLGASIAPLDFSVNVAFPAITQAFALDTQAIRWIPLSYVLTYGVLVIGFGALGDRIGHLRVFRLGLIMGVVALTLCAVAPNYLWLILARVLQGISMALTLSCAPALVTFLYAEHERTRALSAYGSMTSIASLVAPLAGGLSIALMGWPGVYWFRVPLALIALAALPRIQSRLRHHPTTATTRKNTSTLFLLIEIFKTSPPFIWINVISIMVQMGSFTIPLLAPYYLSNVAHWGPTETGAVLAIWASGTLIGSALAARIALRIGTNRAALIAGCLCTTGLAMTALWSIEVVLPLLFGAVFIQGAGLGLFQVSYSDWVVRTLPVQARGVAGGLTVFTRTIGVVSAALLWLWSLEQVRLEALTEGLGTDAAFLRGFHFICWLSATLIALTLMASSFVRNLWLSRHTASPPQG